MMREFSLAVFGEVPSGSSSSSGIPTAEEYNQEDDQSWDTVIQLCKEQEETRGRRMSDDDEEDEDAEDEEDEDAEDEDEEEKEEGRGVSEESRKALKNEFARLHDSAVELLELRKKDGNPIQFSLNLPLSGQRNLDAMLKGIMILWSRVTLYIATHLI